MGQQFLITNVNHGLGHIILNAESSLNALNQVMAEELLEILAEWENNSEVSCIFLEGAGERAFCAGGDIKNLYQALKQKDHEGINPTCLKFFITEYTLDYKIHTYSKPIITWNTGITMGGGMGLMNGASHRIVTQTSLLAMPEISIGLYPDVGATYFFNKLPPGAGLFLGLTGARLNAGDALTLGLSDFFLKTQTKEILLKNLIEMSWDLKREANDQKISSLLKDLSTNELPLPWTKDYLPFFEKLKDITSVSEFINLCKSFPASEWFHKSMDTFFKGSPMSASIILHQLQLGRGLSLKEAFQAELNLSVHCSLKPDFVEGVRALLIDKDQNPQWSPPSLDEITQDEVACHFIPLWVANEHPFDNWMN